MQFQESETIELKAIVKEDLKKEIIAFANTIGGTIYIGVQDDGKIIGVDNPDQTALRISNMVRDGIKPDLTMFIHYEALTQNKKNILKISVQQGSDRPYYLSDKGLRPNGVYVRQGFSSAPAADTTIRQMIKETDGHSFENMRSLKQELNFEVLHHFFKEKNLSLSPSKMKSLKLIGKDDLYTNLGYLLSDECPFTIKAAVFLGENEIDFSDREEFSGSLIEQLLQTMTISTDSID